MKEKEYPMPDDYHEFLGKTLKMIEIRDNFAARLKYTAPELREKVRIKLAETDKLIEKSEALLARQYEDRLCTKTSLCGSPHEVRAHKHSTLRPYFVRASAFWTVFVQSHEDHQKNCRDDEEWEVKMRKMERFYVCAKHRRPDMFGAVATSILKYVYKHEDGDAFHDRIRILEATELDEILDDKNLDQFDF